MTILQLSAQSFVRPEATLEVVPLAVAAGITVTYEWYVDDDEAPHSTGPRFVWSPNLYNSTLTARASYVDVSGVTLWVLSEPVKVNAAPAGAVQIAGTFEEDGLVTATSTVTDLDGMGDALLAYQWLADGVDISGATEEFFVLTQAEVGKRISARVSYTDGDGRPESVTSSLSTAIKNIQDPVTGTLRIDGNFTEGQTLTAVTTDLADQDGLPTSLTYLWKADGVRISGVTGSQWVLGQEQVGKTISLSLQFTDLQGHLESLVADNEGQVANVDDPTQGSLKIAGEALQGVLLKAVTDFTDEDGIGSYAYQWLQNGVAIEGATQSSLLVGGQAFVGKTIGLQVIHTDLLGTVAPMFTAETAVIANANDLPSGAVTIDGDLIEDATLTVSQTLQDADGMPSEVSYQWLADGQVITGATGTTWVLQQAQVGRRISVQASYTDGFGTQETKTSATTTAIQNVNDLPSGTVEIAGKVREAETLQAVTTSLSDEDNNGLAPAPLSYQWRANSVNIPGATGSSFLLTQAQVGQVISVVVKYVDKLAQAETVTSAETVAVANENNQPTGTVTITGTAQEDRTLTATQTLDDKDGVGVIHWRWLADGQAIAGEEQPTLLLKQAHVGKLITALASYTDALGQDESVSSAATVKVANVQDPCEGTVAILGTVYQGESLSVDLDLSDEDGIASIAYQWLMDGLALSGATQNNLLLGQAQVGHRLAVKVTATDAFGVQTVFQASRSDLIENVNDAPTVSNAVFSGFANKSVKGTLSASDVDGDPFTFLLAQSPLHGQVTLNEKTGLFEYVPALNYAGLDQFTYQATDGKDNSLEATVQVNVTALPYRSLTGHTYFWGNAVFGTGHQLLQNVQVKAMAGDVSWISGLTPRAGTYQLPTIETTQVALTAVKSTVSDATVKPAMGLNDVLSALKLYLGKTTAESSPYSLIAADFDANGKVELGDVLNILKTYLGKTPSVTPQWAFVDASANLSGMTAKACAVPAMNLSLIDATSTVNLIGVLRGDVNGSWSQQSGYDLFTG